MSEQLEGSYPDAIRSPVGAVEWLARVETQRDVALAQVARVRALCDTEYIQDVTIQAVLAALEEPSDA